jgi:hypothetical protein
MSKLDHQFKNKRPRKRKAGTAQRTFFLPTYKLFFIFIFLPPNMAALSGPAIGARNSRQKELGHTAHRALAQQRPINNFILFIPLILLYYYPDGGAELA